MGKTQNLTVKKAKNVTIKSKTFATSDKKVATVTKAGKITAKKAGKVTITVKVKWVKKSQKKVINSTLKCEVTVQNSIPAPTAEPDKNPTASPSPSESENPTESPSASQSPSETPTLVTPNPQSGAGLFDEKGNMVKTWAKLLDEGTITIKNGSISKCNEDISGQLVIDNSVTGIGDDAFHAIHGLTSVTIPDSVTSIGDYAFSGVKLVIYDGTAEVPEWGWGADKVQRSDGTVIYEKPE